jgi:hypothetical protein
MKQTFPLLIFLILIPLTTFGQEDSIYAKTLHKMFEANGSKASIQVVIDQMFQMQRQQSTYVDAEVWDELEKEFKKFSMDDLIEMLVPVYQKYLTREELEEIIAFYETPVGRKFAENTPALTQETMQVGQKWGMQIGEKIDSSMIEKGYK